MNIKRFASLFIIVLIIILTVAFFLLPLAVSVRTWDENPRYAGEPLRDYYNNDFMAYFGEKLSGMGSLLNITLASSGLIGLILGIAFLSTRPHALRKEVVDKVRCSYCNTRFDETLDKCPYCGANH